MSAPAAETRVDPVTYEVLRHRLWSINEEHGLTIARISGSPIVTFSHDFNPCLHLPDGGLVFSGPYIQCLNAGAPNAIRWILETYGHEFVRPGDVFLTNDPWIGVLHQVDVSLLAPVHHDGRLIAWVTNAVHQYDVGGPIPGSFAPDAREVFEEAVPMPPIRIVEEGVLRPDLERMYLRRSRLPDLLALDLRAGLAGCNVASDAVLAAVEQFGVDTVEAVMEGIVANAERAFSARLEGLPDGTWRQDYFIEPHDPADGLLPLTITLTKAGDTLTLSNTGDPPQDRAQAMTRLAWEGAAVAAIASALCHDQLFALGGALRHVRFELVPGSVGAADFPAAMTCANMRLSQVTEMASQVLAKMLACAPSTAPGAVIAGGVAGMPVLIIAGAKADGEPFGTALSDHIFGAIGPSPSRDGIDNGGLSWDPRALVPNVEDQELVFPILYLYRRERADSGGAGRRRGGNGGVFAFVPLDVERMVNATISAGAAMRAPAAPGLLGGLNGTTSGVRIRRDSGARAELDAGRIASDFDALAGDTEVVPHRCAGVEQRADDVTEERWCGSGGFGDPLLREPAQVADDVRAGHVSRTQAEVSYGVVLLPDGELDVDGTAARRAGARDERRAGSAPPRTTPPVLVEPRERIDIAGVISIVDTAEGPAHACAACGSGLSMLDRDLLEGCRSRRRSPTALSPLLAGDPLVASAGLELLESFCPACLALLAADIVPAGRWPSRSFELVVA